MYVNQRVTLAYGADVVAYLRIASWIGLLIGIFVFLTCLKEKSYAISIGLAFIMFSITSVGEVFFLREVYFGLTPEWFSAVHALVDAVVLKALVLMPLLSLVAKVVPESVESSLFALVMGVFNLALGVVNKVTGNLINKLFFGVSKENLSELWKLYLL